MRLRRGGGPSRRHRGGDPLPPRTTAWSVAAKERGREERQAGRLYGAYVYTCALRLGLRLRLSCLVSLVLPSVWRGGSSAPLRPVCCLVCARAVRALCVCVCERAFAGPRAGRRGRADGRARKGVPLSAVCRPEMKGRDLVSVAAHRWVRRGRCVRLRRGGRPRVWCATRRGSAWRGSRRAPLRGPSPPKSRWDQMGDIRRDRQPRVHAG